MERFFKISADLMAIVDMAGRFQKLSDSWARVMGYGLDELLGVPFLDFVHPDDRERTLAVMDDLRQGRHFTGFVNRYRTRSGVYRHLSWGSTLTSEDGLIFAVARDVTEETRQRQDLADERNRLHTIINTIPDLVFLKDRDLRYIGCNPAFESFTGRPQSELLGRDDFAIFPPEVAQWFRDNDVAMSRAGCAHRNEEWLTFPDGSRRLLDTIKVPMRDDGGRPIGLLGISRDITEAHHLRSEVDFLGSLVNRSRDPIYCAHPAAGFTIVHVNDATCALLGAPRKALLGRPISAFDPTMTPEWLAEIWARIQANDTPVMVTTEFHLADGRLLPVEISASLVRHGGEDFVAGSIRDISARRAYERHLHEREALYRASIEAAADGFWLIDPEGSILDVNSAYARMSGYTVEELRTMHISDLDAVETPAETAQRTARIRTAGSLTFESRHRRKDGSTWEVEVTALASDIESGRLFAYLRDLRHRRRAETLLKTRLRLSLIGRTGDLDALLTELLDTSERLTGSTIGFFHFVDADQQTLTLQAWSSGTLPGMCTAEGTRAHYAVSEAGIWADCLRQGRPIICNDRLDAPGGLPDGHAPIIRMMTVPVAGETGYSAIISLGNKAENYDQDDLDLGVEVASMAMDIVNWVRSEISKRDLGDALARTALQWTAAMDSFKSGIAVLDRHHRLRRANAAFYALTDSRPEDRLGKVLHCLTDIDQPRDHCPLCDDIALGEARRMILEPETPGNPSGRPLELTLSPISDGNDTSDGMVLSLYDLSEIRAQEERLQHTISELTRSNAELERFAELAAHDLQEPSRQQVLFAQRLERQLAGRLDHSTRESLDFIIEGALAMRTMVTGLAIYGELGRSTRPIEAVDLDRVAADVVDSLRGEIDAGQAVVHLSPLGDVCGDRSRLKLVLVNLVANALKFRRPEIAPRITLSASAEDGWTTIAVADNGIGIPEEYRGDVLGLLRRLTPRERASGAGLGLAQCRRIIEDIGGRLWIDANPLGGTIVRFSLPVPRT